jgi:hypothetical protein
MMNAASIYVEAAYALAVSGAAMIYPPLALVVAAVFLAALAVVVDRRTVSPASTSDGSDGRME